MLGPNEINAAVFAFYEAECNDRDEVFDQPQAVEHHAEEVEFVYGEPGDEGYRVERFTWDEAPDGGIVVGRAGQPEQREYSADELAELVEAG